MNGKDYAMAMAHYNRWMNERIYQVCSMIPDADRRRDRGAFFKSVHGTLNHILWADRAWLARFTGGTRPAGGLDTELYAEFDELRRERQLTDERLLTWAESIDDAWSDAPFVFRSTTQKRDRKLPAWTLVVHVFNHETHHRGQLTTLLTQMGHDPGITDFPWMPYLDDSQERLS